jgi:ubiquinone/menaquinone biosynthesis C-methylase UbiE
MDRIKDVTETFDEYAEEYDKWFESPYGAVLFQMETEAVRLLAKRIQKPFLEIGVGTGRFAKELGIEFGIDPSPKLLGIALKRGIKVGKAKGERLPFRDESFGAVFILFTLCFVEDAGMVLTESKRVLRKDGKIILGIINKESSWGRLYAGMAAEGHPIYKHARFYSMAEVTSLMEKAGLSIEALSSILYQQPTGMPCKELARPGLSGEAGFVCILAKKGNSRVGLGES